MVTHWLRDMTFFDLVFFFLAFYFLRKFCLSLFRESFEGSYDRWGQSLEEKFIENRDEIDKGSKVNKE